MPFRAMEAIRSRSLTGQDTRLWFASSPDGKQIAYVGYPWKGQTYHVAHLYVIDADGSNQRNLTPDWDRDVASLFGLGTLLRCTS